MPMQKRLLAWFWQADLILAAIAFILVAVVMFGLMLARYVYAYSLPGLEELAMVVFVWFLYLSMVYCLRKDEHIRVDVIDLALPVWLQIVTSMLARAAVLGFSLIMAWHGAGLVAFNMGRRGGMTPVMDIPYYVVYAVLPVSFGLFAVFCLALLIQDFKRLLAYRRGQASPSSKGAS